MTIREMRDFRHFILSEDIRLFHEELFPSGYAYSAQEAGYLVWQCRTASMQEKYAAWQWIIDNMPDSEVISSNPGFEFFPSLHQKLRRLIEENDLRKKNKEAVGWDLFAGMCLDFPVPFKPADIVFWYKEPETPMLLDAIYPAMLPQDKKERMILDSSDMQAICMGVSDGYIETDIRPNYLEIELYVKPLIGEHRTLGLISMYRRKKISLLELLHGYKLVLAEASVCKAKDDLSHTCRLDHTEYRDLLENGWMDI